MPNPPTDLTFKAWQRSTLFARAERVGSRLQSKVSLQLTDVNTGDSASGSVPFTLMAAGDVAGLKPNAVKHMAPAPFVRDAETTKLVHIDLWEKDLPWRYTPELAQNAPTVALPDNPVVPPWLVLLVGLSAEMKVEAGVVTSIDDEVLRLHDLAQSHLWAHTQWDGHREIARILSPRGSEPDEAGNPRGLLPQHEYVAALVPAFNQAGAPMWRVNGATVARDFGPCGVLPALHAWRFWTAEAGDFETLAAALKLPPAADVGKATLHYRREIVEENLNIQATMEVRGAITSLQAPVPPDAEALARVIADVEGLNDEFPQTVGLPHYGRPWLPNPDDVAAGWPQQLMDDPRFRSIAGLGVWMGVEAQEALMDAAVKQAGALREAGQRINHLGAHLERERYPLAQLLIDLLEGRQLRGLFAERLRVLPYSLLMRLLLHAAQLAAPWRQTPNLSRGQRTVLEVQERSLLDLAAELDQAGWQGEEHDEVSGDVRAFTLLIPEARHAQWSRALRATLDSAAHRIDPWITGFAWQRLRAQGAGPRHTPRLGVYGWVDGPFDGVPGPNTAGRLHTPSYNQTLAALILRDRYLSAQRDALHNEQGDSPWAMNISSQTARLDDLGELQALTPTMWLQASGENRFHLDPYPAFV